MKARNPRNRVILEPVLASASMRRLDAILRTVAEKEVTVTLVGETGSGKEVLARRVHELSARRGAPFVPINCAAIPESLFESELFGHEKGAFTGADSLMRGKVEAASGGTLFLDEIGDMPLQAQAKLLRFLESRRFMRVGGTAKVNVDVRLVCATLQPLEDLVKAGQFRADLYYRIQGVVLRVPPLRERPADLVPLIEQFLVERASKHGVKPPRFTRAAFAALRAHSWPGNVRELRNLVELMCLLRQAKVVRLHDLPLPIRGELRADPAPAEVLEVSLAEPLDDTIDKILRAAVELERGNRSRAARRLGVGLRTIQRRLGAQA
ncbi:MAG: sigma-54-dependent Fis family transcriptional regulator [Deltaproteobacteria bacterium]|nr:sigma-54-dependent Fis family transcriptional regulator [Deltaproteobacteria bacterium]